MFSHHAMSCFLIAKPAKIYAIITSDIIISAFASNTLDYIIIRTRSLPVQKISQCDIVYYLIDGVVNLLPENTGNTGIAFLTAASV